MSRLNRSLTAAFTLLALAGTASAAIAPPATFQYGESGPRSDFVSRLTREQVAAELRDARTKGLVTSGEAADRALFEGFQSTRTRDEVRAEAIDARRQGLVDEAQRQAR